MVHQEIKVLAGIALNVFEWGERDDGTRFWKTQEGAPDWVNDMVREVYDNFMPDDARDAFIRDALLLMAGAYEDDLYDTVSEVEADVYTSTLTAWLHSSPSRVYYLTEVLEEYEPRDGFEALALAQYSERREVYMLCLQYLEGLGAEDLDGESYAAAFSELANRAGIEAEEALEFIRAAQHDGLTPLEAVEDYPREDDE